MDVSEWILRTMGSLKEFLEKQNVQENSERCSVYAVYEITEWEAFLIENGL